MKAVNDKVIQQTTDSIERPPGGGDPATEPMPQPWVRIQ